MLIQSLKTFSNMKMFNQHTLLKYIKMTVFTKSKNHYDTLNVSPNATFNEIKTAYYKLTLLYHPDKNKSEEARIKFQNISEAYEVLGNFSSRKKYDRSMAIQSVHKDKVPKSNISTESSKQHMEKIYNFDEWVKAHYGKSFTKYQTRKAVYQGYKQARADMLKDDIKVDPLSMYIVLLLITIFVGVFHFYNKYVLKEERESKK